LSLWSLKNLIAQGYWITTGGYTNLFWWFLNNGLLFQNQTIKNLEARVQQLMVEAENSNLQRQKLSQEKTEAEQCYQAACSELQEMKAR